MTYEAAFADFKQTHPSYDEAAVAAFREKEFPALDRAFTSGNRSYPGHAYLDYTGGNLSPKTLIDRQAALLSNHILGNPHSRNPSSDLSSWLLYQSREAVLDYFNAKTHYCCVFTANASASLKIVGECYPFHDQGAFVYLEDDHNSVLGIRQHAHTKGADYHCLTVEDDLTVDKAGAKALLEGARFHDKKNKLFAFPAQSNATGMKHDLELLHLAKKAGWDTLLDAAAFVPTNQLDLGAQDPDMLPDYVCISFYKMFGLPTGVGCLLIKVHPRKSDTSPFAKLWRHKPSFAGGTVEAIACESKNLCCEDEHISDPEERVNYSLHRNYQCFEDGTVNYLSIPMVQDGLAFIRERNGTDGKGIYRHVSALMTWLVGELRKRYSHERLRISGEDQVRQWGSTIQLKCYKANGAPFWAGNLEDHLALFNQQEGQHQLSVRIGTFCNPGIDRALSRHEEKDQAERLQRAMPKPEEVFEYQDPKPVPDPGQVAIAELRPERTELLNSNNNYPGSLRVSLGMATNFHDLYVFLAFIDFLMNNQS